MNFKNILSGDSLQYKHVKPKLHLWVFNPSSEPLASRGVCILDTCVFWALRGSCAFERTLHLTRTTARGCAFSLGGPLHPQVPAGGRECSPWSVGLPLQSSFASGACQGL